MTALKTFVHLGVKRLLGKHKPVILFGVNIIKFNLVFVYGRNENYCRKKNTILYNVVVLNEV